MATLALDTTTAGSVAVLQGGTTVVERRGRSDRPHATRLPGDLFDALAAAGCSLDDVTLLAVASGPGSFTGLRIGIATMQGLALARGLPLIGISALDALADAAADGEFSVFQHAHNGTDEPAVVPDRSPVGPGLQPRPDLPAIRYVIACMDAARGEVFSALYEATTTACLIAEPVVGPIDRVLSLGDPLIQEHAPLVVGDGALRYRDALHRWRTGIRIAEPTPLLASWIGRRAEAAHRDGASPPPHAIQPLYVRRPDAEIARDRAAALPKG